MKILLTALLLLLGSPCISSYASTGCQAQAEGHEARDLTLLERLRAARSERRNRVENDSSLRYGTERESSNRNGDEGTVLLH